MRTRIGPTGFVLRLATRRWIWPLVLTWFWGGSWLEAAAAVPDPRHLANGWVIPDEGYCDQPYVVRTADGAWLCALTTASGHEGSRTQHVITQRSTDRGRTWSAPVRLESPDAPENSYAVLLATPSGRVYCFYNFNAENRRDVLGENGRVFTRVDTLGQYVFRYSDDQGRSWSARRYPVPVREFDCDRANPYAGQVRFFWNVGRPLAAGGVVYVPLHKVGAFGDGFLAQTEGAFLRSTNLLHEPDPERIGFETLPDGRVGLRTPPGGGRIAEEQSLTALSDGTLYCVYRSVDGHPVLATSADGGHTWTPPVYHAYTPGGRRFRHPRAANFVWRCANGRFLYWFHHHGGRSYDDRNPAWLSAGREVDTPAGRRLDWSQPEILLYDDDPLVRLSYPDLIEEDDGFYVTETQKEIGRVHRIEAPLLEGLFGQWTNRVVARDGLALELGATEPVPAEAALPELPAFVTRDPQRLDQGARDQRAGFTLDLAFTARTAAAGQILLDNRTRDGRGFRLSTAEDQALELRFGDGRTEAVGCSDAGSLEAGRSHRIAVVVDGGPKIICFVVDGVLCDGGTRRQFGWGRYSPHLQGVQGDRVLRVGPGFDGEIRRVRLYRRALRISEVVGNHQAAD